MLQSTAQHKLTDDQMSYLMVATIAKVKQNFGLKLSHRLLVSTPPSFDMYEWHKELCLRHHIPALLFDDFKALWSKAGGYVYNQQSKRKTGMVRGVGVQGCTLSQPQR